MDTAKKGYVSANGAKLYYEMVGSGKTLVFVHGLGLDHRMWNDQFPAFSDQYRLLRYDLRGFGRSSLPSDEPYSHHEDLYSLLQHLDLSNITLIGLSMGGRVVIDFALTYPELVSAMVLVNSAIHGYPFKSFSTQHISGIARESGIEMANNAWLHHELFGTALRQTAVAGHLREIVASYSGWHWMNKNPWTPISPQAITRLDKITSPALVISGEEDLPDFRAISDILEQDIKNSKKIILQNTGHMCNVEDSSLFNTIVLDFLRSLPQ